MIIGTAGHIDHGKTTLIRALTGVETYRHREERERGITIDPGYAYHDLPGGKRVAFVDVPGHERFVHNMLAGATGIDYFLLIVAADGGIMPQTIEHLDILALLEKWRGAVVLTRIDLADAGRRAEVKSATKEILFAEGLVDLPFFEVSSITGEGISILRNHIEEEVNHFSQRRIAGHFRMPIDRVFTLPGAGTIVTGSVCAGEATEGETLYLAAKNIPVRVRSIRTQNRISERAVCGDRAALNISGAGTEDIRRGDWILAPQIRHPAKAYDGLLSVSRQEMKPLRREFPAHFHAGTGDVAARIQLLFDESVEPGAVSFARIILNDPLYLLHGDRFIVRDISARRTIGGGRILDIDPPGRGRSSPARRAILDALSRDGAKEIFRTMIENAEDGVSIDRLSVNLNLKPEETDANLPENVYILRTSSSAGGRFAFAEPNWRKVTEKILIGLKQFHEKNPSEIGPDRQRLRLLSAPSLEIQKFAAILNILLSEGRLCRIGARYHVPGHRVLFSPAEEKLWTKVFPLLNANPHLPPRVRDIAGELKMEEKTVRFLLQKGENMGELYQIAKDHFYTRSSFDSILKIFYEIAGGEDGVRAARFRDRLEIGRKVAVQILEYLDRNAYSRRAGESHFPRVEKEFTLSEEREN